MSDLSCPNCDGPVTIPHHSSTVVCPYCSTTVQVSSREILKESYLMRVQYSLDDAWKKMLDWAWFMSIPATVKGKPQVLWGLGYGLLATVSKFI